MNFLGSPTGAADAGAQSTIGDVTGAEEGFEFRRRGGPHGAAGVPANGAGGACFSRNGQSSEGCTSQQASSEKRKGGTTNKHVNKKLAPSIRNTDITQSLKNRETLRELDFIKIDTRDSTIQLDLDQLETKKSGGLPELGHLQSMDRLKTISPGRAT